MNGSLAGPALDAASLGSVGAYGASLGPLNRSLGLGSPLLGSVGEPQSNRVEAYLAKVSCSRLESLLSRYHYNLSLKTAILQKLAVSWLVSYISSLHSTAKNLPFPFNICS